MKANLREQHAQESREALLRAGEELLDVLLDEGRLDPLRLLSPTGIAARAGRAKGLIYHLWPVGPDEPDKLRAYRRELGSRVFNRPVDASGVQDVALGDALPDLDDLIRRVANYEFSRFAPGGAVQRSHRFAILVSAAAELGNESGPAFARAITRDGADDLYQDFVQLYQALLDAYGLEMAAPLTLRHLAAALSAMVEGFGPEAWLGDAAFSPIERGPGRAEWSLFAIAALGVVRVMTHPKGCAVHGCTSISAALVAAGDEDFPLCIRHLRRRLGRPEEFGEVRVVHDTACATAGWKQAEVNAWTAKYRRSGVVSTSPTITGAVG